MHRRARHLVPGLLVLLLAGPAWAQASGARVIGQPVACTQGTAVGFACNNVDLMAFLPLDDLGDADRLNDLWGWTDPETDKEYALVGHLRGTAFIDVSDPANPVWLGTLPSHTASSIWRDVKTYAGNAYVVAEARFHGVQVFDLTQLREVTDPPVVFDETAHYDGVGKAHNIVVNEETGFAYVVGANSNGETCGGGLHMLDLREHPTFAGCFSEDGYTHDAQCVVYHGPDADHQGREICLAANVNTITLVDVTDKTAPALLSRTGYPNVAYAHQGWLTEDHRYFLLDDEQDENAYPEAVPTTRTLIWDVIDLDDPQLLSEYFGPTDAIDHNLYVVGDYVFQANFTAGLRILDISDVAHPVEVGFFDTVPGNDEARIEGVWGVYPFFDSGTVVVSSIGEGVFVLKPTLTRTVATETDEAPEQFFLSSAHPNPFNPQTSLTLTLAQAQPVRVAVYDVLGREVAVLQEGALPVGAHQLTFEATGLPSGTYLVRAMGTTTVQTRFVTLAK